MKDPGEIRQTEKQLEIMELIFAGVGEGFIDLDTLWGRLSYGSTCSRQAVWCSIKFLVKAGLVEKKKVWRRKAVRVALIPTPLAYSVLKAPTKPP